MAVMGEMLQGWVASFGRKCLGLWGGVGLEFVFRKA